MQVNTYVVEDNFDFWNELNIQLDESTIDCDTICLITKEPPYQQLYTVAL